MRVLNFNLPNRFICPSNHINLITNSTQRHTFNVLASRSVRCKQLLSTTVSHAYLCLVRLCIKCSSPFFAGPPTPKTPPHSMPCIQLHAIFSVRITWNYNLWIASMNTKPFCLPFEYEQYPPRVSHDGVLVKCCWAMAYGWKVFRIFERLENRKKMEHHSPALGYKGFCVEQNRTETCP